MTARTNSRAVIKSSRLLEAARLTRRAPGKGGGVPPLLQRGCSPGRRRFGGGGLGQMVSGLAIIYFLQGSALTSPVV